MSAPQDPAKSGRSLVWLQGLACGLLAALAPAVALLGGVLLLPGLLALPYDRATRRSRARSMLLFGTAAGVQPVMTLWHDGPDLDSALALIGRFDAVAGAWAAAAVAWLLAELLPLGVGFALRAKTAARVARLRAERARIVAMWGEET